ncbi:MAG: NAD(P)/FAD-dependent oxidoreductase, partial [Pleurocapsa sp.]
MTTLPGKPVSFWLDSTAQTTFHKLENVTVDVAIVGAGITGITAAYLLKKAGKTVALVEAQRIAASASGHTTAKVTSLHQLIYADLIDRHGEDKAKLYGESNQPGVEFIASTIKQEAIDCDFQRNDTYSFAEDQKNLEKVQKEYDAAIKLGLPAHYVYDTTLPYDVSCACKFTYQAQLHVRKYLFHIARTIAFDCSYIFEYRSVQTVDEGTPCKVYANNTTLQAKDVLLTSHLPFMDQGLYFAKAYPQRSYIIGAKFSELKAPLGMYIGGGDNYHSIRTTPAKDGSLVLLIG